MHVGQEFFLFAGLSRYLMQAAQIEQDRLTLIVGGLGVKQGKELKKSSINLIQPATNQFTLIPGEKVELYEPAFDYSRSWIIKWEKP